MRRRLSSDEDGDNPAIELRTLHNADDKEATFGDSAQDGLLGTEGRRRRASSDSSVQSFELYTPDEERIVVRKLDRHVVAFMSFLYLLSFLDRSSTSPPLRSTSCT